MMSYRQQDRLAPPKEEAQILGPRIKEPHSEEEYMSRFPAVRPDLYDERYAKTSEEAIGKKGNLETKCHYNTLVYTCNHTKLRADLPRITHVSSCPGDFGGSGLCTNMGGRTSTQLDIECDSCERARKEDMDLRALSNMAKNLGDYGTRKAEKEVKVIDAKMQQSGVLQGLGRRAGVSGKSEIEVMREKERAAREAARKARREEYLREEAELLREKAVRDARRKAEREEFMREEKEAMKEKVARRAELDTMRALANDFLQNKMDITASTPPQKAREILKTVLEKEAKTDQTAARTVGVTSTTPPQKAQEILKTVYEKDAKSRMSRDEKLSQSALGRDKKPRLKIRLVDSSKAKPAEKKIVSPVIASLDLHTPISRPTQNPPAHLTKQTPTYNHPTKLGLSARHDLRLQREMERDAADFQPPTPKISPPVKNIENSPLNFVFRTKPTAPTPIPMIEAVPNIEMSAEVKGEKEEDWEDVVLGEGEDREEDGDWEIVDV